MVKKGYLVKQKDDEYAVAVVATSSRQAKRLGFPELSCDWIDVRVTCVKDANVIDLPIGVVRDMMLALRHGIYDWIEDYECDICHEIFDRVHHHKGQVLCGDCLEKAE